MEYPGNIFMGDDDLNEEQLKKYISGKSSPEEQHAVERQMQDSAFLNDAVEGLQHFSKEQQLDEYVTNLNKNLQQHMNNRKQIKEKRKIRDFSWIIIAVITILLLCVLAFVVIKMQHENRQGNDTIKTVLLKKSHFSRNNFSV